MPFVDSARTMRRGPIFACAVTALVAALPQSAAADLFERMKDDVTGALSDVDVATRSEDRLCPRDGGLRLRTAARAHGRHEGRPDRHAHGRHLVRADQPVHPRQDVRDAGYHKRRAYQPQRPVEHGLPRPEGADDRLGSGGRRPALRRSGDEHMDRQLCILRPQHNGIRGGQLHDRPARVDGRNPGRREGRLHVVDAHRLDTVPDRRERPLGF